MLCHPSRIPPCEHMQIIVISEINEISTFQKVLISLFEKMVLFPCKFLQTVAATRLNGLGDCFFYQTIAATRLLGCCPLTSGTCPLASGY